MGITFIHTRESYQDEIESLSDIANIVREKSLRNKDDFWVESIIEHLLFLYQNISPNQKQLLRNFDERKIKEFILNKLETNDIFTKDHLLTVDLEAQNKHSDQLGFYDIKIRSSLWDSYFSLECKCLDNSQISIIEYVCNPNKSKKNKEKYTDGGIYRFLINKYSKDIKWGGMIGFIRNGDFFKIKKSIFTHIKEIKLLSNSKYFGILEKEGIIETNYPFYFQSYHSRYDISENRECAPVKIHHFLYDFTE